MSDRGFPAHSNVLMRALADHRVLCAGVLLLALFLLAFSTFLQDLGWLMWGAERALTGGKLYRDYIEMNPPLVFVLNMLPQQLAQLARINAVITYDLFVMAVIAASVVVTGRLYRPAALAGDGPPWGYAMVILLAAFTVIPHPFRSWGQRDFLMAVLVVPYVALLHERVRGRDVARPFMVLAVVLGAVGIGLKPHFVLPFAAMEIFVMRRLGPRRALSRPDPWILASLLTAYLLLSMLAWPEYFRLMRELGGAEGYSRFSTVSQPVFVTFGSYYALLVILLSLAVPARPEREALRGLLRWTVVGCWLSALAQQKAFDYHLFPAIAFATLLLALVIADGALRRAFTVVVAGLAVLLIAAKLGLRALWTLVMLAQRPGNEYSEMIDAVNGYAPRGNIVAISLQLAPFFPAVTYTEAHWSSAVGNQWHLPLAYEPQRFSNRPIRYHTRDEMQPLERYMFDRFITDLDSRRPHLIMLRKYLVDEVFGDGRFNYLVYYSQDDRFRRLMSGYRLLPSPKNFVYYGRSDVADRNPQPLAPDRSLRTRWSANCHNCLE